MTKIKRVLVTGASGFIGGHLTADLTESFEVEFGSRAFGIDLMDEGSLSFIKPCNSIVHLAGLSNSATAFENAHEIYKTNISLTLNSLKLAVVWQAEFIFVSSYIYGAPNYLPVDEEHPVNPHNPYSNSKFICEQLVESFARDSCIQATILRPFNLYGPNQPNNQLIAETLSKIKNTDEVKINDPAPKRDYLFILDFVEAISLLLKREHRPNFEVFNVGSGVSHSVQQVIEIIQRIKNNSFSVSYSNLKRRNDVLDCVADCSKLKSAIGWESRTSLITGLRYTIGID